MPRYSAETFEDQGTPLIRLRDSEEDMELVVAPELGNRAIALSIRGQNILHFPFENAAAAIGIRGLNGIPFLAPWGNRMAGGGFWAGFGANARWFPFPGGEKLLRLDSNGLPIHGLLTASKLWHLAGTRASDSAAECVSRLAFWWYPELMANWPFAHEYEMTYRLADGALEVRIEVLNLAADPMPLAIGFHPYFVLPGVKRDDAVAHIPVQLHVETDAQLVATGQFTPAGLPDQLPLKDRKLDDGFTGLARDAAGNAVFQVAGGGKQIEVAFGPKFPVAIVYAPPGEQFFCIEPMTAITNGVNLAHDGRYDGLQVVEPNTMWSESFHIRPSGF